METVEIQGGIDPQIKPAAPNSPAREDWERNHFAIRTAITLHIKAHKAMPTYSQIAEATKLHLATVKRHMLSLKGDASRYDTFRALTEDVVMSVYEGSTIDRNDKCQKLWAEWVEGWQPSRKVTTRNESPFADLSDEELDRQLAEAEGKPAPAPSPAPLPTPIEGPDGPAG